eukprot:1157517-Pelagomonas_calceolata.AAC.10
MYGAMRCAGHTHTHTHTHTHARTHAGGPFPRSTGAISKRASSSLHAPQVPPPRLATPAASPFVHAPNSPALQFPYQPSSFPPPAWTDPSHSSGSSGGSGRSSLHGLLGLLGGQHLSTGAGAVNLNGNGSLSDRHKLLSKVAIPCNTIQGKSRASAPVPSD